MKPITGYNPPRIGAYPPKPKPSQAPPPRWARLPHFWTDRQRQDFIRNYYARHLDL